MPWTWLARLHAPRQPPVADRVAEFARQRDDLQRGFFAAAAASGKPRGLRWKALDWQPDVAFARDRRSGQLAAFAGVTVAFEAVEGGDMEGVAAVGNLRLGSAVFVHQGGRWQPTGRTLFNLTPAEAVAHFGDQYEPVTAGTRPEARE